MKSFKEFINGEKSSKLLVVNISGNSKLLLEYMVVIEEGKIKEWINGYSYRLDRRPDNHGGDQLHIFGRRGDAWAYRHNGTKSEPNKYTSPATNIVKNIVSDIFKIDKSKIEETILSASAEELIIEIKIV